MSSRLQNGGHALMLSGDGKVGHGIHMDTTPQGAQVLARVAMVGICATDIALLNGTYAAPHQTPVCFGHEWAGIVEAVGPAVRGLRPGDRVTGECSFWCGACDRCRRNKNLCRHIEKFGITRDGAARDRVLIEERYLHRGAPGVDLEVLALAEPLAVCHQGIVAGLDPGPPPERVLILGGGMIGLGCAVLLRQMFGCRTVYLHDMEATRRERARTLGAEPVAALPAATGSGSGYSKLYDGDGFDLILETTGAPSAFCQALGVLNPGGTLALLGFTSTTAFAPKELVLGAARIVGSIGGSGSFEAVVPWLANHAALARRLISHSFAAADAGAAFAVAQDRQQALKVQVRLS